MIWFTGVGMAVIQSQIFLFPSDSLKVDIFIMGLTTLFSIALEIPGFFFAPLMRINSCLSYVWQFTL